MERPVSLTRKVRNATYVQDIVRRLRGKESIILQPEEKIEKICLTFCEMRCYITYPDLGEKERYALINVERPEGIALGEITPGQFTFDRKQKSVLRSGWAFPAVQFLRQGISVEWRKSGDVQIYQPDDLERLERILARADRLGVTYQTRASYLLPGTIAL